MKKIIILLIVAAICAAIGAIWFFYAGRPAAPEVKTEQPPAAANDLKYETYAADDFEIKYPAWPKIDPQNLGNNDSIKLGVTNGSCNVVISAAAVPQGTTFKTYTEKKVADQVAQTKSTIVTQEITDNTAYFAADVTVNGTTLRSVSHGYLTSKGQSYGIAFVSKKDQFNSVCQPFIEKAIESAVVK